MTDVGAGGCDSRSGAGAPRWHPRCGTRGGTPVPMLCPCSGAGLWQCLSSQGLGRGAVGSAG